MQHKKKNADTFFTCTDFTQQKIDELFHGFHSITEELNLKINTLSLITPMLALIENPNSWQGILGV